jgi:LPS-assembly lipoprotein
VRRRALLALTAAALMPGCGFQARGRADLPFESLYVEGMEYSPFTGQLKRAVERGSSTKLTQRPEDAQAILSLLGEVQERLILAVSGGGRVREFQLRYRVIFRVHNGKGTEWLGREEVVLLRELPFDDTQTLAREAEAQLLFRDMQRDAVLQLLRRVQALRPSSSFDAG